MSFDASYVYRIKDLYSAALNKITRATNKFKNANKRAEASMKKLSTRTERNRKRMDDMRASMGALAGTAGLTFAFKGMIDTASKFEQAMNSVESKTNASTEEMKSMRKQARMLGETTQFSATQAADGMKFLAMAGLEANQVIKAMPGILNLAAAGELDLGSAADITTNILSQFGMKISEIGRVNDVLAVSAASSNTSVLEMAEAMKNTGSLAKLAGMDLEEVSAALMIMAKSGTKGGMAGTQLMNVFRELSTGGPKLKKLFKSLGGPMQAFVDIKTGRIKDFVGLITAMGKTSDKSELGLKRFTKAFDVRAAKGIAVLAKAGGKEFDSMKDKVTNVTGASKKMSEIMMKGLPGAEKRFKSATESLSLSFTAALLPALSEGLEILANLFSSLAQSHPIIFKIASALMVFAVTLGIVATAGLLLTPVIAAISWPMVLITGAIMATVVGLVTLAKWLKKSGYWKKFAKWIRYAWDSLKKFVKELHMVKAASVTLQIVWTLFKGLLSVVWRLATFVGSTFWVIFKGTFNFIVNVVKVVIKLVDVFFGVLKSIGLLLTGDLTGAWDTLKKVVTGAIGSILDLLKGLLDTIRGVGSEMKEIFVDIFTLGGVPEEIEMKVPKITEEQRKQFEAMKKDKVQHWKITKYEGKDLMQLKAENELTVKGGIRVTAEPGTQIKDPWIYVDNNGKNLAGSGA